MAALSTLLSVSEPGGFWPTIIKAFEGGVGSYILAIVLITLIIRIIWAPFDTVNKKINKKNQRIQQKMAPELEKIKLKYGNDKNLLNQKTQELYRRHGFSMAGSCVFMLVFMALNMTIFFTLFAGLNVMADYKISEEYDYLKYNYANVLALTDQEYESGNSEFLNNYQNITFKTEVQDGKTYLIASTGEKIEYKTDFSYTTDEPLIDKDGKPVLNEDGSQVMKVVSSDEVIANLVHKWTSKEIIKDEEGNEIENTYYIGDKILVAGSEETDHITYKDAFDSYANKYVKDRYDNSPNASSFLWIKNYWIADSPFKNSIFTFDQFKAEIGASNVSAQEGIIYNAFMPALDASSGRVNGYLILAILSIGVSFLSIYLSNLGSRKKGQPAPPQAGGKVMMIIMPIIMGIFAIFYNSVFAIYMVVGQAISAALSPLENLIIKKWDAHDEKKAEEKNKSVVSYRRK